MIRFVQCIHVYTRAEQRKVTPGWRWCTVHWPAQQQQQHVRWANNPSTSQLAAATGDPSTRILAPCHSEKCISEKSYCAWILTACICGQRYGSMALPHSNRDGLSYAVLWPINNQCLISPPSKKSGQYRPWLLIFASLPSPVPCLLASSTNSLCTLHEGCHDCEALGGRLPRG